MKAIAFALLGAVTGALAAVAIDLLPLGEAPAVALFGHCFGMRMNSRCTGLRAELYVFPGLIFGVGFAILLRLRRQLRLAGAGLFAIAAALANAAALFVFAAVVDPIGTLLEPASQYVLLGLPGAIAGAVGGGLLGFAALRLLGTTGWFRVAASGAALGLLLPFTDFRRGEFLFYMVWQAGYAAILFTRRHTPYQDR